MCVVYGTVLMLGLAPFILQGAFASFLVTVERPKLGLKISIAAGITNMALDYLFIYAFRWGLPGAAAATVIGQMVGGVIPLIFFFCKNGSPLRLVCFRFEWTPIVKSCVNGSSEMLTNLSMSLLNMLYNLQLMKLVGENGVSAYGIIMYVSFIFTGTYMGYSLGISPVIGYHYGAANKKELQSLLRKSLLLIAVVAIGLTALSEVLAGSLAGIFVSYDAELMEMTTVAIQIYSPSYLISGFNIFGSAFFTALTFVATVVCFLVNRKNISIFDDCFLRIRGV